MTAWLEVLGLFALAAAGTSTGRAVSRLRTPYWVVGFAVPFAFFVTMALVNWAPAIVFAPVVSWITDGRREFAIFALACPLAFATLAPRLHRARDRRAVGACACAAVVYFSLGPFLLPAVTQGYFSRFETTINNDGICIQSNGFTCGPAAAVTALRRLGLPAEEGDLATAAHTNFLSGTAPDWLCNALRARYGPDGLSCRFRPFSSIDELPREGITIAVVKFTFLVDHYVAVLEVTDNAVVVGDPLRGKCILSHEEFGDRWRYTGIVLERSRP